MEIILIFNICITISLILRTKNEFLTLLKKHCLSYLFAVDSEEVDHVGFVDLPIIRFGDLESLRQRTVDRMCFICSEDYGNDDVVCQLSRCGDVFHSDCVGKLLHDQKQTYCPSCRTPVFSGLSRLSYKQLIN
ncbi:hypothetical protein SSX86_020365 [Deinandra increscens subsp. villosa]|uniref:RING-type domain-containing protein n=1 Tax=Deinandra increscens subsp. villosa TaxID=3103831 RepID=A0AAP0CP67_9ASTR